ncbi:hypothetical protein [Dyadobacter sp. LHD-138]|uniref:hypothetical protein n=1 Tax=Dyadobacter sp. LHD-138 TaxID=3071413 RepID=UPI0027DFF5BE|nr:hypothetical protein [Dyadobacter sp. LHD-138]MDQ6478317.1 hypothetical protein [Dyadobacter sp. LHD-138]
MKSVYILLLTSLVLSACQKSSVDKKEEGLIHYKETVAINDVPSATLTFFDINDSRCPEGAQCITAGSANIDLALDGVTTEGRITKHVKMCLGDCFNFQPDTLDEEFAGLKYRFILKAVNPFPKVNTVPNKPDYNIALVIEKK